MNYQFSDKIAALKPSAIREILKAPKDADTISLAAGNPAPETFPVADLARFAADIFENDSTTALQYGATDGYEPLRRAVAQRQKTVWGIGKSVADGDAFDDTQGRGIIGLAGLYASGFAPTPRRHRRGRPAPRGIAPLDAPAVRDYILRVLHTLSATRHWTTLPEVIYLDLSPVRKTHPSLP